EIFGTRVGWFKWQRPGFDLGIQLCEYVQAHAGSGMEGIILAGHGLFTWGDTSKACYETSLRVIEDAATFLEQHVARKGRVFGPERFQTMPDTRRREVATAVLPTLRGLVGQGERKIGHFDESHAAMEFINADHARRLAALGTSCPDHF